MAQGTSSATYLNPTPSSFPIQFAPPLTFPTSSHKLKVLKASLVLHPPSFLYSVSHQVLPTWSSKHISLASPPLHPHWPHLGGNQFPDWPLDPYSHQTQPRTMPSRNNGNMQMWLFCSLPKALNSRLSPTGKCWSSLEWQARLSKAWLPEILSPHSSPASPYLKCFTPAT